MSEIDFKLHPRQMQALFTPATELIFGGATEGGKSHFVRVALILWCLQIPGLQCILIRKKKDDIIKNHVEGRTGFRAMLSPLIERGKANVNEDGVKFWNGSLISFVHCQDERQFDTAQGVEKNVIVIDEATQISERLIRFFRAWCRMPREMKETLPEHLKGKFPRIIYTANPIGPSVPFFRRQFVKARKPFEVEKVDGFLRQYIPSRYTDNASADEEALKGRLAGLNDAALAKALEEGDWDAPIGEYFTMWDESRHVVPDFLPPAHWYRWRSFDWGSAEPFAVYWFAVSDGEMFDADIWVVEDNILVKRTKRLWFPRGARIVYREWYGCDPDDPAKGIGMRNAEIAKGIVERSPAPEEKNLQTLTDSYVFPDRGETDGMTVAKVFAQNGVTLTLGDTRRVTGWKAMKDAFSGKKLDENSSTRVPMLFIQEGCRYARDYIPALPRHPNVAKPEDAAENGEATHSCDAIRLGNMANEVVRDAEPPSTMVQAQKAAAAISQKLTFNDAVKMAARVRRGGKNGGRY